MDLFVTLVFFSSSHPKVLLKIESRVFLGNKFESGFFREKLNMDLKKLSTNLEKTKWLSRFFFLDRITKRGIYIYFLKLR